MCRLAGRSRQRARMNLLEAIARFAAAQAAVRAAEHEALELAAQLVENRAKMRLRWQGWGEREMRELPVIGSKSPAGAPEHEVEVTPSMIDAGVCELDRLYRGDGRYDLTEKGLALLFRAMATAMSRPPDSTPRTRP
jgi:hypothetical protein